MVQIMKSFGLTRKGAFTISINGFLKSKYSNYITSIIFFNYR